MSRNLCLFCPALGVEAACGFPPTNEKDISRGNGDKNALTFRHSSHLAYSPLKPFGDKERQSWPLLWEIDGCTTAIIVKCFSSSRS